MDSVSRKSHGPSPASQTSLYVLALSELKLRAILRDDDWERGGGSGRTVSEANGNERGAVACMCTAGDLGKVRGGSEQDKAREEGTAPSAPARASAHRRRVLVSLDPCVVLYLSLELIDVCCFVCVIRWYVQSSSVVSS